MKNKSFRLTIIACLLFIFQMVISFAIADIPAGVKDSYKYDKHDESIIIVKKRLQELGYFPSSAQFSDFVSKELKSAVISFQLKNGIKADGTLDKKLLEKLFSDDAVDKNGKKSVSKAVVKIRWK